MGAKGGLPDIAWRASQADIAEYIGVTPNALSRIKKRLRSALPRERAGVDCGKRRDVARADNPILVATVRIVTALIPILFTAGRNFAGQNRLMLRRHFCEFVLISTSY